MFHTRRCLGVCETCHTSLFSLWVSAHTVVNSILTQGPLVYIHTSGRPVHTFVTSSLSSLAVLTLREASLQC